VVSFEEAILSKCLVVIQDNEKNKDNDDEEKADKKSDQVPHPSITNNWIITRIDNVSTMRTGRSQIRNCLIALGATNKSHALYPLSYLFRLYTGSFYIVKRSVYSFLQDAFCLNMKAFVVSLLMQICLSFLQTP
jgi:hypothetical protein